MVPAFCPLQTERGVSVSKEYGPRGEWGTFLRLECQPEILLSPMARECSSGSSPGPQVFSVAAAAGLMQRNVSAMELIGGFIQ